MLIYGFGGFAIQLVFNLVELDHYPLNDIYVFSNPLYPTDNSYLKQFHVLKNNKELKYYLNNSKDEFLIAFSSPISRAKTLVNLKALGGRIGKYISPKSDLSNKTVVEDGTIILQNCIIEPECEIKKFCILNAGVKVFHGSVIQEFSEIGPNTTITGNCIIGKRCVLGAGVTTIPNINICNDVIIGAGSTIVKNINEPGIYIGSPARRLVK